MPDMWMDVDAALSEVPVNLMPLLDDTDFKSREESVAYNAAGLELIWHFTTTAGATTATVVTPTTGGAYDWAHQDGGLYTIEIPASGGASINNDTEGFGWFTGVATGVLPWRGPVIGFRAAGINNALIDSAYSTTRGLAGTALPDAAADAAGGLPISDAGGLDLDAQVKTAIDGLTTTIGVAGAGLTALGDARLANLDATVSSRSTYAGGDTAGVTTLLARLSAARAGYLDELNKLATALELDGAVYRFTANALEQAPTGSGSGASLEDIEASTVLAKEATVAAVDAKVSALGASVVTVTSPVSVDASTVTLVCGDDYYDADGRALTFTDSGGTYPAFTAGSCKFTVRDLAKGTDTETAGTIVDANTVRFELAHATSTDLWPAGGKYRFDVEVTLANGHEVTIATGTVTMLAKYSGL